jgi:hypothetical protein
MPAIGMRNDDDPLPVRHTGRQVTRLSDGMIRVFDVPREWITEHRPRFLEGDTVMVSRFRRSFAGSHLNRTRQVYVAAARCGSAG